MTNEIESVCLKEESVPGLHRYIIGILVFR